MAENKNETKITMLTIKEAAALVNGMTELEQVEAMRKLEKKALPADIDYNDIKSLRLEAIEKLNKIKPVSVGQASRISGVNPADVGVLLVWLSSKNDHREE